MLYFFVWIHLGKEIISKTRTISKLQIKDVIHRSRLQKCLQKPDEDKASPPREKTTEQRNRRKERVRRQVVACHERVEKATFVPSEYFWKHFTFKCQI